MDLRSPTACLAFHDSVTPSGIRLWQSAASASATVTTNASFHRRVVGVSLYTTL